MAMARPSRLRADEPQGTLKEIADGLRYVLGVPWLWITIFLASFILMVAMAPYTALLPAFVEEQFDRGVGSYGLLFTLQSLGMAFGSLAFGQTNPSRRRVIIMYLLFAANDICVIAMTLTHSFTLACVFVAARGVCIGYGIGVWSTLLMQQVPSSKLARVTSLDFGSFALIPVGYALTAAVAGSFSPATLLMVGFGLSTILCCAAGVETGANSGVRSPEEVLRDTKTIALVGASPNPAKPSHGVMRYLVAQGYDVVPVRPLDCDDVLGVLCVATLAEIDRPIDLVDVFRRPEHTGACTERRSPPARRRSAPAGIRSEEARRIAMEAGLDYVDDPRTAVVHRTTERSESSFQNER